MTPLQSVTVYVPVDVKERLPERMRDKFLPTIIDDVPIIDAGIVSNSDFEDGQFYDKVVAHKKRTPTHWLEERKEVHLLTEKELVEIIKNSFNAGCDFTLDKFEIKTGKIKSGTHPSLLDFIKTLIP